MSKLGTAKQLALLDHHGDVIVRHVRNGVARGLYPQEAAQVVIDSLNRTWIELVGDLDDEPTVTPIPFVEA